MAGKPKKSAPRRIAPIRPREPLTNKAKRAIERYVFHKGDLQGGNIFAIQGIYWTLEAERMSREQLYIRLEEWGYRWKHQRWEKKS